MLPDPLDMTDAVPGECALLVQENKFIFRQNYGIKDINCPAISTVLAGKHELCFYQLRDGTNQFVRSRHVALQNFQPNSLPPMGR
jgi:hypothetical protein